MKNYLSQINEFIFKFHIKLKLNWEKFQFSIKFLFGVKQTWYIFILRNNKLHCKIKIYNTWYNSISPVKNFSDPARNFLASTESFG